MPQWITAIVTIVCAFVASSGFWAWLQKKDHKKNAYNRLLIGIAHDRIMQSGMYYINRGYITKDEYEDFRKYLYEPYQALGGNGSAERIMKEVDKLEIKGGHMHHDIHK